VIPFYNRLFDLLDEFTTTNNELRSAIVACKSKLSKYYSKVDSGPHANLSLVLNPRCKLDYHRRNGWDPHYIRQAKTFLDSQYRLYGARLATTTTTTETATTAAATTTTTTAAATTTTINSLFDDYMDELLGDDQNQQVTNEVERYISSPIVGRVDALVWWKERSNEYPILSTIARDFFATPGNKKGIVQCVRFVILISILLFIYSNSNKCTFGTCV
jgi:hypothetical protein